MKIVSNKILFLFLELFSYDDALFILFFMFNDADLGYYDFDLKIFLARFSPWIFLVTLIRLKWFLQYKK